MAGEGEHGRTVITTRALMMVKELQAVLDAEHGRDHRSVLRASERPHVRGSRSTRRASPDFAYVSKDGTVILLPSHKSHLDYLILTYILFKNHLQLPLIAAGDIFLSTRLGLQAFRAVSPSCRSFRGDRLYGAVADAYVRKTHQRRAPMLEFFLEGGRSRTGKLLPPKIGFFSMVVDGALGVTKRPVDFCPISIGYERVVEERSFVHELSGGEKEKEDIRGLFSTASLMAGRYGRLNVQFGELLTLENVLREFDANATKQTLATLTPARRRAVITRLAYRVMKTRFHRVTAVTPASLVATILLAHDRRGLSHDELVHQTYG